MSAGSTGDQGAPLLGVYCCRQQLPHVCLPALRLLVIQGMGVRGKVEAMMVDLASFR